METDVKITPMMAQWHACKSKAGDALLFFRMGDFYEAFYEDAALIAREVELTLTMRQEVPMCGVPVSSCEGYIDRLVAKGYRVAVAEQTSDPKASKGLVSREVVRVVTPGTVINSALLSDRSNNFFASITQVGSLLGFAILDLTTADFRVIEFNNEHDLLNEIIRVRPAEFIIPKKFHEKHLSLFHEIKQTYTCLVNTEDDWHFEHQTAYDFLIQHFKVHSLDGFGLTGMIAAINAAGALMKHLQDSLCLPINHIGEIHIYSTSQYMALDRTSLRNLELTHSLHDGSRRNTLLEILDQTQTPMGARLIHHWIKQPLMDINMISKRQDAVEAFCTNHQAQDGVKTLLGHVRDIERLMMKASSGYAAPRDLAALKTSLEPIAHLKIALKGLAEHSALLCEEETALQSLPEMTQLIGQAIVDEAPLRISDGNIIREGYHAELDELRALSRDSKSWIANYQINLRDTLGIKTLKVGYNRMFGYYIEVSKGQADRMPQSFHRRQTLVNAERFISPELKEYEGKVLTAEERISGIETELFHAIREEVAKYAPQVLRIAKAIAQIDCLLSLAEAAKICGYVRPAVSEQQIIHIEEGRHPVIERTHMSEKFIPNDTLLDDENNRLLLITGPNMAGKSTYIRQVALISIMAQIGSFVPAKRANIGIVDKVFTRIGANDDLSRGQSTFMVEMTETANILNNATSRSLVILDEIGRGTSTYDGISIAWSVAEYLLTADGRMAKTLFATHYWELTKLEEKIPGAVNYHIAVHESHENIIFLRRIVRGGTDKSYGIHVGKLAGLPSAVIERSKEILIHLEENANRKGTFEPSKPKSRPKPKEKENKYQLSFFN